MQAEERRQQILTYVHHQGWVKVTAIAGVLAVAPETVRRDLGALERLGLVRRTYGGAYPVETPAFDTDPSDDADPHSADERRIAAEAVRLLGDAETVFVDEGRTPQLIAAHLPEDRPLTVVTASLATAAAVADSTDTSVLLLGGRVRPRTPSTVGPWACKMLSGLVIDLAFIGAHGITREFGVSTSDPVAADVKAEALRVSRRRVFVGHHSTFGVGSVCRFAGVADFDAIVTDTGLSTMEAHRYALLGPRVLTV